ncbi:MAG: YkgJ family cysteine cluster protein [Planctomycetota bacterium]
MAEAANAGGSKAHNPSGNVAKPATPAPAEAPWYRDGLRFTCTGCGDCCTGAPGYVWLNKADIAAMAAAVGLEPDAFERRHVRQVGVRKSLKEHSNGDCVFLDSQTRGCTVYQARPRQCRTWPFWDSTLRKPEAWAETCEACPGAGTGKLYPLEQIEAQRSVVRV